MSSICFKNVSKSFNKNPVLKSADFTIEKGEICGFVGRNGSGKTVIFKLMTGLLLPDSGTVLINYSGRGSFFPSLGVMIETPGFIPHYSGLKNLKILNSMSSNPVPKNDIKLLMKRLGLDPKNPRPVRTYSLGMRQKLGIILDEPMNSLDVETVKAIRMLFSELNAGGTTIVIASHISEDIETLCTRIFRVENAQVTEITAEKGEE